MGIKAPLLIYRKLYEAFGPQRWWPGETRLEIIVGAILTQNTAWSNVEKAIANLKSAGELSSMSSLAGMDTRKLARHIRPAGYYNVKARRLKNCLKFLRSRFGADLRGVSGCDTRTLRDELLAVNGIGPETCDSILLYAFERPVFVVDAYTRRIFSRHGLLRSDDYHDVQKIFTDNLPKSVRLFNEFHALIVRLGKEFCRTRPRCGHCPLNKMLANGFSGYYNVTKTRGGAYGKEEGRGKG